ncbi:MAG: hypothetical protein M3N50_10485 [Pseudomonadota bacterium]|nr:hypothetical protein [Pseudomonadota bacterium]
MSITDPTSGRLAHLGVMRFTGIDAASFLQGQISNDTRRLAESKTLFAAYSNPQGRVLALLRLMPHSSGILGLLPRELVAPTMHALSKYVLRARVKIEDASELLWVLAQQASSAQEPGSYFERDGVGRAAVDAAGRHWILGAPEALRRQSLAADGADAAAVEHAWRLADIRAGLPQIYLATREAFVAQMLNLDRLEGISFSKGCYTGQEIIARTQHLGRIKRRLYRLRLPDGEWSIGQALRLTDGRAGRLCEVARSGSGFEALAVLNVEAAPAGDGGEAPEGTSATKSAVAAVQLALPYSL